MPEPAIQANGVTSSQTTVFVTKRQPIFKPQRDHSSAITIVVKMCVHERHIHFTCFLLYVPLFLSTVFIHRFCSGGDISNHLPAFEKRGRERVGNLAREREKICALKIVHIFCSLKKYRKKINIIPAPLCIQRDV